MHIAKSSAVAISAVALAFQAGADTIVGARVLTGKDNFNSLGASATFSDQAQSSTPKGSRLSFYHNSSGTGVVETAFTFDCANVTLGGDDKPAIMVTMQNNKDLSTRTVFKGDWTGSLNGGNFSFFPNSDPYGNGGAFSYLRSGTFTLDACSWWFQNDTSDLTISDSSKVSLIDMIWVADSENAFGPGNNAWDLGFKFSFHRGNRLQGVLTTSGRNLYRSASNKAYFEFLKGNSLTQNMVPVTLIGIADAGYAEIGRIEKNGVGTADSTGMEMPVWFYAAPGGTVRFTQQLVISKAHLPVQILGGGTVIMSSVQSFETSNSTMPFWVRDGRLVAGGKEPRYGVGGQNIQVGVEMPKTIAVRLMTQASISWYVTAYDGRTLTLKQACPLDGRNVAPGDRVLLNSPMNVSQYNGVYVCVSDTEWRRDESLDESTECVPDTRVTVSDGNKYAGTSWYLVDEPYRARQRLGLPQTEQTFKDENYSVAFFKEDTANPKTALLLEDNHLLTNTVRVVDNGSTEASVLGGYSADSSPSFTGSMTIERPDVVLTAESGSTVTFAGRMSGRVAVAKIGDGKVALTPSDSNLTVTNLSLTAGTLALGDNLVIPEKRVTMPYGGGASVSLEFVGNVNLVNWTFDVTGIFRPAKGDPNPASFEFSVSSSGGMVSGVPTINLLASETVRRSWHVESIGNNTWRVFYRKPGMIIHFH